MTLDPDSLERLVPEDLIAGDTTGGDTLDLHRARYEFASGFLSAAGRCLDIACGVGYGTRLLAKGGGRGVSVLGVDISPAAIDHARRHYAGDGIEFRLADAMRFHDPEGFDAIVSLETIEHLEHPGEFVDRLADLLRPGGVLIASVPTTPSVDLNPHHRHDFHELSFRRLVQHHEWVEIDCLRQTQPVNPTSVLVRREMRMQGLRRNLPIYYARHPDALWRRLVSTLRHGFCNRYITVAWRSSR